MRSGSVYVAGCSLAASDEGVWLYNCRNTVWVGVHHHVKHAWWMITGGVPRPYHHHNEINYGWVTRLHGEIIEAVVVLVEHLREKHVNIRALQVWLKNHDIVIVSSSTLCSQRGGSLKVWRRHSEGKANLNTYRKLIVPQCHYLTYSCRIMPGQLAKYHYSKWEKVEPLH